MIMVSMQEGKFIRKYQGTWEIIQLYVTVPAFTTIIGTYTPPTGFVYIPTHHVTGAMAFGAGTCDAIVDGEYEFQNLVSSPALQHLYEKSVAFVVWNNIQFVIRNIDAIPRQVDFISYGFVLPKERVEEFLSEFTGKKEFEDIVNKLDELKLVLERIDMRLSKIRAFGVT